MSDSVEFTCQQMRDLVRSRGHYLAAGVRPDRAPVLELTAARDAYKDSVGLSTYLSQMLGELATFSMRHCVIGWPDGRVLMGNVLRPMADRKQQVQVYLRWHYANDLPYAVEVRLGVGHIQVRYL